MTEDLNTPMLHMRLPSRGSKILRRVTMKRKEIYVAVIIDTISQNDCGDDAYIFNTKKKTQNNKMLSKLLNWL